MRTAKLPILTYHSLDDTGSVVSVAPSLFSAQVAQLAERGFQTMSLAEAARLLQAGHPVPDKRVVITFDDGYRNLYTEALPVLQQHGYTATIFLIASYCGAYNDWPGHVSPVGRLPLLDWSEIRELHAYGIEFGAHTLTHPDLTRLPLQSVEHEIVASKEHIQDKLGVALTTFAYPYGHYSAPIKTIVSRHFQSACTVRLGRVGAHPDLHALERVDMYYLRTPRLASALRSPFLDPYLYARQAVRDWKTR